MSEIPFIFSPIPPEFMTDEFLNDPIMMKLIRYIFKRVRPSSHTQKVMNNRTLIQLDLGSWEFMYGREKAALECGCSEKQIRTRIELLRASSYLEEIHVVTMSKGYFSTVRASSSAQFWSSSFTQKRASTFTVYRIVTESLSEIKGQQILEEKGQQMGQQFGKKKGHKEEELKKERFKESHHPDPSSKKFAADDDRTDDLSKSSVEVVSGIFLSQKELQECIAIKGSLELVQDAISYILSSKARTKKITNWPNALENWIIKNPTKNLVPKNESRAKRLEEIYEDERPWSCRCYKDSKKDQRGILFENMNSRGSVDNIFIAFTDLEYDKKVDKTLREKKMQKGRINKDNEEY